MAGDCSGGSIVPPSPVIGRRCGRTGIWHVPQRPPRLKINGSTSFCWSSWRHRLAGVGRRAGPGWWKVAATSSGPLVHPGAMFPRFHWSRVRAAAPPGGLPSPQDAPGSTIGQGGQDLTGPRRMTILGATTQTGAKLWLPWV